MAVHYEEATAVHVLASRLPCASYRQAELPGGTPAECLLCDSRVEVVDSHRQRWVCFVLRDRSRLRRRRPVELRRRHLQEHTQQLGLPH